jgi:hypothetical protein
MQRKEKGGNEEHDEKHSSSPTVENRGAPVCSRCRSGGQICGRARGRWLQNNDGRARASNGGHGMHTRVWDEDGICEAEKKVVLAGTRR